MNELWRLDLVGKRLLEPGLSALPDLCGSWAAWTEMLESV